jgi:hypothetical protein
LTFRKRFPQKEHQRTLNQLNKRVLDKNKKNEATLLFRKKKSVPLQSKTERGNAIANTDCENSSVGRARPCPN